MRTVAVETPTGAYEVCIGEDLIDQRELVRRHVSSQAAIITNKTVGPRYAARLAASLDGIQVDVLELEDGEAHKTLDSFSQVLEFLAERGHNRSTTVFALGGGVVGDLAGFAAATYQRGVKLVQVPTTLLAQVDSSVGGKTAVDLGARKNYVGAFYQPNLVIADTAVLRTLDVREVRAGLAEVLKYGVIRDAEFFAYVVSHAQQLLALETDAVTYAVERSCQFKADVVAEDEQETGIRAILNYGHTFGHAIEQALGFSAIVHGEAVAIGMVLAADLACRSNRLSAQEAQAIRRAVWSLNLPDRLPGFVDRKRVLAEMAKDKKVVDGRIRFVLATSIGAVEVTDEVDLGLVEQTLNTDNPCGIDG